MASLWEIINNSFLGVDMECKKYLSHTKIFIKKQDHRNLTNIEKIFPGGIKCRLSQRFLIFTRFC